MEWYWEVLIIVGYFLIGGISAAIADRLDSIDEDFAAALILFWPIFLAVFLVISIIFGIIWGCKWVVNKLFYAFALSVDRIKSRRELRKAKKASCSQYENAEEPDSIIDDIDYVCPGKLRKRKVLSSFTSTGR